MKRTADTDTHPEDVSASGRIRAKRPKSSQACSSCRKHKTRCELLDGAFVGPYRCHRCKVLNISCSFESSDFAPPLQDPGSSTSTSQYQPTIVTPDHSTSIVSPLSENHTANRIEFEELLHVPTNNTPWGFMKEPGFDWTATPMLAMQKLTSRSQLSDCPEIMDVNASLTNILTSARVKSLLDIFELQYHPWLNLQPYHGRKSPLLTLARCTVASRHLDPATRSVVVPQLQRLTEDAILKQVFNPMPSIESIEAILILSLWAPVGGSAQAAVSDGRLLAASGISMAMNLRLSQAVAYVAGLRNQIIKKSPSDPAVSDLDDAMAKARLWFCLMNFESMLCVGTGRNPLSHRTALDHTVIDSSSNYTVEAARDMRLALMGQIFEVTELGLGINFSSKLAIGKFHQEVVAVLMKYDNLLRLISPLPEVAEHESAYFHILKIYYYAGRLLFLHHILCRMRRVVQNGSDRLWYQHTEHNGVNVAAVWGHQALLLAEEMLSSAVSRPDLSTAPDNVFVLISWGAAFLVICKYAVHQIHGSHLPGSSDALLAKIIDRLSRLACGPDHTPAKCAQLLSALVGTYKARTSNRGPECDLSNLNAEHHAAPEGTSTAEHGSMAAGPSEVEQPSNYDMPWPSLGSGVDLEQFMNSDIILDSEFWSSFMENITIDAPLTHVEGDPGF